MKIKILVFSLIVALFVSSCEEKIDMEKHKSEMREYAHEYMKGLKGVLVANMKKGGPLKAVNVCSDTASVLAEIYSEKMNVEVKRVSFKNRNQNNYPNDFEGKVLKQFEKLQKEGQLNTETELIEKQTIEGQEFLTYIKPFTVQAPCLNCHGSEANISPEVAEVLLKKYPEDKAVGYEIGDLRGAVSVSKKL